MCLYFYNKFPNKRTKLKIMSNTKKEIMAQKVKEYESALFKYVYKISENRTIFFYDMLSDFSISIWLTILSDIWQYIHLFFYIYNENVSNYLFFISSNFIN